MRTQTTPAAAVPVAAGALRLYWPKKAILDASRAPPPVKRVK